MWEDRGAAAADSTGLTGKQMSRYSWREDGQSSPSSGQSESAPPPPPEVPVVQSEDTVIIIIIHFSSLKT